MPGRLKHDLWEERVHVKLQQDESRLTVPVPVFMRPETGRIESYWVLGFGAGSLAVENVLKVQAESGLAGAAVILPYAKVPYKHMVGFTNEVIPQVVQRTRGHQMGVRLAGDSRGGGAALRGAGIAPDMFRALGLLEPAFLTTMGDTPNKSLLQLLLRLGIINPPRLRERFHSGTRQTAAGIFGELGTIGLTQGLPNLKKAVELVNDPNVARDSAESLDTVVAKGIPTRIWYGTRDPVFPGNEYRAALKEPEGLDNLLIPLEGVPHVAMGTPQGLEQVQIVTDFLANPGFAPSR